MKTLIWSVIVVLLVIGAVLLFNKSMSSEEGSETINMENENTNEVEIIPIEHASMVLRWGGLAIYTDPVGEAAQFAGKPGANIILLTDIHGDHLDPDALKLVTGAETVILAPQAVADAVPEEVKANVAVLNNGEMTNVLGFKIEAIPMYNLPESATAYHTRGRGNGYVIERGDMRVYVSGDTSDITEMRNLRDIDKAFVAMNLPYTMSVEQAADAVLAFKPKEVYPYHFRTPNGFSDIAKFKQLVSQDPNIVVVEANWYPTP